MSSACDTLQRRCPVSVYHCLLLLTKLNSKGNYDRKNINVADSDEQEATSNRIIIESSTKPAESFESISKLGFTTYKELDDVQLKCIIELINSFDKRFRLFDLEFNKLEDEFIANVCVEKVDKNNKHLEQISSIVSHVEVLLQEESRLKDGKKTSTCLVELGAGRGKLSYW